MKPNALKRLTILFMTAALLLSLSLAQGVRADGEEPPLTAQAIFPETISAGLIHTCRVKSDGTLACWGDNSLGQSSPVPGGTFSQVSAGSFHTCGLKSDGTLACWGAGTTNSGVFPNYGQSIPPAGTFTQVSAGFNHSCGLKSDGTLACWGRNINGESTPPGGTFTQVSTGIDYTCGLKSDGTLACWGRDDYGQSTPPIGTFFQVSAGDYHACGLQTDGMLVCWGENTWGQSDPPAETFTQVSAGGWHTCGLKSDGALACWGNNDYGQSTSPTGTFNQVSAGYNFACGLKSGGLLACWGENGNGQATTGSPPGVPVLVSPANNALVSGYTPRLDWGNSSVPANTTFDHYQLQVASDSTFSVSALAIDTSIDGVTNSEYTPGTDLAAATKYYWRVRAYSTLDLSSAWSAVRYFRTAIGAPSLIDVQPIYIPTNTLLYNRPTFDWEPPASGTPSGYTLQVSKNTAFTLLVLNVTTTGTAHAYSAVAYLPAKTLLYWRVRANHATFGPGAWATGGSFTTANPPSTPVLLSPANNALTITYTPKLDWNIVTLPAGTSWDHYRVQVASDANFTTILRSSEPTDINEHVYTVVGDLSPGTFYWRVQAFNTLDEYSTSTARTFRVPVLADAGGGETPLSAQGGYPETLSAGGDHTCRVKSDGTLACWGNNSAGISTPPVGTFTQVSAGFYVTCGLKSDGTLACWGNNDYGESTPPGGTFTQVNTGASHSCGVKSDGTLACWGAGTTNSGITPHYGQSMPPAGTFTQVSAGDWHTCGVESDGTLACWGRDNYGQSTPPAGTFTQVSAGSFFTCGLRSDNTIVCWGSNGYGETTPPAETFTQISAGGTHTCGLKSDGTLACWGAGVTTGSCDPSVYHLDCGQSLPPAGTFTQVSAGGWHTCGLKSDGMPACWGFNKSGQATTGSAPGVPLLVSPASNALVSGYTPRLDWSNSTLPANTTFDHYQVQVASNSAFSLSALAINTTIDGVTNSEYTPLSDLNAATQYHWRVRAYSTLGLPSAWSAVRTFRTVIGAPSLVGVTPIDVPTNTLKFNRPTFDWDPPASGTPSGYNLQVSRYNTFNLMVLNTTTTGTAHAYSATAALPANTLLYWRARANHATFGPSAWSTTGSFTTANPPSVPVLLLPANNALTTDYTPRFDWGIVTLPSGVSFNSYVLQTSLDSNFDFDGITIFNINVHEFTLDSLDPLMPNTTYYWRVLAQNSLDQYSASAVRTLRTALSPPVLLLPTNAGTVSTPKPTFDWGEVSGASGYTIQVSTYHGFTPLLVNASVAGGSNSTYTALVNLPTLTTLYWRVRTNGTPNGPGPWSDYWTFCINSCT